jgi:lipopolysaccharide transport system ATP-binding protein
MSQSSISDIQTSSTADQEVLVKVEGVSKKFCRSLKKSLWYGVCDIAGELNPLVRHGAKGMEHAGQEAAGSNAPEARDEDLRDGEFYAVRDVSFELRRGECLGLIGHNGAGKTTLLKMLNGLIKPDRGRIEMNGRVGALIALGAGFNPILTGRENIYINGSVLGLSKKEIDEKIDDIIDFSDIRASIDMPVQSYSSGMAVRLGFSVASSLCPDVLILDEVLAVGDMGFVVKCLNRLRSIASNAAVILVSHNMQIVSAFCSRVVMMQKGKVMSDSDEPSFAIGLYYDLVERTISVAGTSGATVHRCQVRSTANEIYNNGEPEISRGTEGFVMLEFEVGKHTDGAVLQLNVNDLSGTPLLAVPIFNAVGANKIYYYGKHSVKVPLGPIDFNSGAYSCTVILRSPISATIYNRTEGAGAFRVISGLSYGAKIVRPARLET